MLPEPRWPASADGPWPDADRLDELKPGASLELRITRSGYEGLVIKYKIRKGKQPSRSTQCLPPGAKNPKRC